MKSNINYSKNNSVQKYVCFNINSKIKYFNNNKY
jgi:hypothetical protein